MRPTRRDDAGVVALRLRGAALAEAAEAGGCVVGGGGARTAAGRVKGRGASAAAAGGECAEERTGELVGLRRCATAGGETVRRAWAGSAAAGAIVMLPRRLTCTRGCWRRVALSGASGEAAPPLR